MATAPRRLVVIINKLTFDWRKIPRPERSGYLSVLLVYAALCFYGEMNGNYGLGGFSVICHLFPWECMKEKEYPPEPPPKKWEVTRITFGLVPSKKKICSCHVDLHYFGQPIHHFHEDQEQTCESEYSFPREWTAPPTPSHPSGEIATTYIGIMIMTKEIGGYREYDMNYGQGEFRFHCETR